MSTSYDRLHMMATFIRIVEAGSISGAARELRLAQSSVSRQLRQLEDGLGVSLLFRTTHRLSLTEAGRSFLADCHRMVREWNGIEERFREDAVQPRGKLRVVASVGLGQLVLVELAARYCRRYPEVELEWNVDDGPLSVVETGIDCLIKVGRITEESLITKVVAQVRGVVVAAPSLIAERGMPAKPSDLAGWPMISIQPYFDDTIPLRGRAGTAAKARGSPRFVTRNVVVARGAAQAGIGFTLLPQWLAEPDIQTGRLRHLLPGWETRTMPLSVGTPAARHSQLKIALFIEEITRGLKDFTALCASYPA